MRGTGVRDPTKLRTNNLSSKEDHLIRYPSLGREQRPQYRRAIFSEGEGAGKTRSREIL